MFSQGCLPFLSAVFLRPTTRSRQSTALTQSQNGYGRGLFWHTTVDIPMRPKEASQRLSERSNGSTVNSVPHKSSSSEGT